MMPGRPRKRPAVLIVDDEPETCVLLKAHLEEEGMEVVGVAHGGMAGVSMAGELSPDVVLMDLRMPDLDGLEATRAIKQAHPKIQVILLTFYDDIDWSISVEQAGAFCYLVKGCPPSIIVDMLRQAWDHRRGAPDQEASAS